MAEILLVTVNARFLHSAFGLRYLMAALGDLQPSAEILELTLEQRPRDIVEAILQREPRVVGLSVYIWNVAILTSVAALLKRLRPDLYLILGGPEVSHEWEGTPLFESADALVRGEGEVVFPDLCRRWLQGERPTQKVWEGGLPDLARLASPYPLYSAEDLRHGRIVYVEASRGCPFRCHFCLSSLDRSVRPFPLPAFLQELERLWERGVRQFKFVDRTFNLKTATAQQILEFFLQRQEPGMFLHFEMIPDRLPAELKPLIAAFPAGVLQFEIGIQSWDPEVCQRIGRRQDFAAVVENLTFLAQETGVHVHADLIAGLPGEDLASFGRGFDRLVALRPAEIQVGILKRLKGTPLTQAQPQWGMVYSQEPPYEVLQTAHLSFVELQRLQRFSRFWDLVANSGRHGDLLDRLLQDRPFARFLEFSDWLYARLGTTYGIAASRLRQLILEFLEGVPATIPSATVEPRAPRVPKRQRQRLGSSREATPGS